jgi:hypothetical protein
MSTDIVVYKKDKPVGVSVDTFAQHADSWQAVVESGSELFVPVLPVQARAVAEKRDDSEYGMAKYGLLPGFVTFTGSAVPLLAVASPGTTALSFAFLGVNVVASLLTGFGSFKIFHKVTRKEKAKSELVLVEAFKHDKQGLKRWLDTRYGLASVTDDTLYTMVAQMYRGNSTQFVSTNNEERLWNFAYDSTKDGWFVEELKSVAQKEAGLALTAGKTSAGSLVSSKGVKDEQLVEAEKLPGECAVLLESFQSRQSSLAELSLSTEAQHVIRRSQEDLRQALSLYSKMVAVGKSDIAAVRLGESLSLLIEELNVLLEQEFESLDNEFQAQHAYLKSRQLGYGQEPGLVLDALEVQKKDVVGNNVI